MADASNSNAPKAASEPSPDDDDDHNAQHSDNDHHDPRGRDIESSSAPASINTSTVNEDGNVEALKPMPMPRRPPQAHHPSEPVAELSESPSSLSSFSTESDTSSYDSDDVSSTSDEDDMREATEMHRVSSILRHRRSSRSTLRSGGGGASLVSQPTTATDSIASSEIRRYRLRRQKAPRWYDGAKRFWTRHISVVVPANDRRDHLALERTFLGYFRTSLILSMTGVMVAQLFRLQHSLAPDPTLGYFVLGIPLAATFICASIAVILIGAIRCWRQQGAMARGKVIAGGFEVYAIMVGALVVCFVLLLCLVVPYTPD